MIQGRVRNSKASLSVMEVMIVPGLESCERFALVERFVRMRGVCSTGNNACKTRATNAFAC